jgi:uncharacterized membrane protein YphA (DoxX/SURF4 family)
MRRWIEGRDGERMQAAGTWRKWIPIIVMIAWIYVGSSLLQNEAPNAIRYTILGAVIGITEVLIGLSIAAGQVFPFATGLVFLGMLLLSIPLFHAGFLTFPPDHWKLAVALAGSAALLLSSWIRRTLRYLSIPHRFEYFDRRPESKLGLASREDLQILIKLNRNFDFLRKRRCTVIIRHPRGSARNGADVLKRDSERRERHSVEHDHKLPFWVR